MDVKFIEQITRNIDNLKLEGLYKYERIISSPQQAKIKLNDDSEVLNFCANNYLGLANDPRLIAVAKQSLDDYGFGLASVRFICGTQDHHVRLEKRLSDFLRTEDTILFSSCFDANSGIFEALLGAEDVIISDALNHASIIDGTRLCKAKCLRYEHNNMTSLREQLQNCNQARYKMIVTDGVFSMDGTYANLPDICELAQEYNAMVMVDDSHAVGVIGPGGRGTPAHFNVEKQVDIITGTLGKALGGASGGYICAQKPIVSWLRQKSRPYLFSNTLAPSIPAVAIAVLDLLEKEGDQLRAKLFHNTDVFRNALTEQGFILLPGVHPIVPVILKDAKLSAAMAEELLKLGIYVVSFSYPVVAKNMARIRVQLSAAHSEEHIKYAINAFHKAGKNLNII